MCNLFIASFLYILEVFEGTPDINFRVCPKHRDSFGIKWRGRKNICQVPEGVTSHRSRKHTGDRTISKKLSEEIFNRTGSLIPVGSGIHLCYRYLVEISGYLLKMLTRLLLFCHSSSSLSAVPRKAEHKHCDARKAAKTGVQK